MTDSCVRCGEHESDFDPYLCQECANEFQVDSNNLREFYGFLARIGKSYLISYLEQEKNPDKTAPHAYFFSAPAVSFHNARRFNFFCRMAELVRKVPGDIVECGVEHGQSLLMWLSIAFDELMPRNVWGFDSFSGPEKVEMRDSNADGDVSIPKPGTYKTKTTKAFIQNLNAYGLPTIWTNSHLVLVPGFFSKTLGNYSGDGIAVLHLDVNFYDSYKTCLEAFYPKLSTGAVVILDEYGNSFDFLNFAGAKKAIDEFLSDTGEVIRRDKMYGKFFFIKGNTVGIRQ